MSFKQGTVAATKQLQDKRWALRFDRKEPLKPGKSKSWYVYLLLGSIPPAVGEMWRIQSSQLKQLKDLGGNDCYEELPIETLPATRTLDTEGDDIKMEQAPPTHVESLQMDMIDGMGWVFIEMLVGAMGRHEEVKGLTVGEVGALLMTHPKELKKAIAVGIEASAEHLKENIRI